MVPKYELLSFQPLWWEYIWCISLLLSFLGLDAIKKNKIAPMRRYMFGLIIFGYLPLLYAIIYYFRDVWTYLTFEDEEELEVIHMWQVKIYCAYMNIVPKKIFAVFLGFSIWLVMVCIYIPSPSSTFIFLIFCMEFDNFLEIKGHKKIWINCFWRLYIPLMNLGCNTLHVFEKRHCSKLSLVMANCCLLQFNCSFCYLFIVTCMHSPAYKLWPCFDKIV